MRPRRPAADLRPPPRLSPRPLRPVRASALLAAFALAAAACGGDSEEATGPEPAPNQAPTAVIEAPASDTTVNEGEEVTLEGSATDPEDGRLTGDALEWASDVDGELGTGETVTATLTPDTTHAVTLTATDSEGATDEQEVGVAVEPNQKPAARIESPSGDTTVSEGDEVTFRGSASDPEDGRLTGDALEWASDVDGTLGTGDSVATTLTPDTAHTVTLTATDSHGATGTAGLGLSVLGSFRPRSDTELSGEHRFADVEIPEGVTVTVTGDLTLRATGAASIGGGLVGDCVEAEVLADSTLAVTGIVNTACGELPDGEAPGLKLVGEGGFELEGAEVRASGDIVVATDPEASADTADGSLTSDARPAGFGTTSASRPPGPASVVSGLAAAELIEEMSCAVETSRIAAFPPRADKGEDGTERGKPGHPGSTIMVACPSESTEEMVISNSIFSAGDGGHGGDATNEGTSNTVKADAGDGGEGGSIFVGTVASLKIRSSTFEAGDGGDGGDATATALQDGPRSKQAPSAEAVGGSGGHFGTFGTTLANGSVTLAVGEKLDATQLEIVCASKGSGGNATATGANGLDAKGSESAQVGGDASATGGKGFDDTVDPDFPNEPRQCVKLERTGTSGAIPPDAIVALTGTVELGDGGVGGGVVARPGDGGNGDLEPDGADAGDAEVVGGDGGTPVPLGIDAEGTGLELVGITIPGRGGEVVLMGGRGGRGVTGCRGDGPSRGGHGGKGADLLGDEIILPGFGGGDAEDGSVILRDFGNGGDANNGEPPGTKGPAGNNDLIDELKSSIFFEGEIKREGENFQPGAPGGPCGRQIGAVFNDGDESGSDEVIALDADGDNLRRFGPAPCDGGISDLESVDGFAWAYEEGPSCDGNPQVAVSNVNDGTKEVITTGAGAEEPAVTLENRVLYGCTAESGAENLCSIDPDGSDAMKLSDFDDDFDISVGGPVPSGQSSNLTELGSRGDAESSGGDNRAVMGGRREGENFDLYLAPFSRESPPTAQEDLVNLTDTPEGELDPQPSPDGERLAFGRVVEEGGSFRITVWLMDLPSVGAIRADGVAGAAAAGETQVAPGLGFAQSPDWCPDGGSLVFIGEGTAGNPDLFRANADGTGVENLTRTPNRGEFEPDCAGEFVAYVTAFTDAEGNTAAELFRLDFGGGEPIQLTDLNGVVRHPAVEP